MHSAKPNVKDIPETRICKTWKANNRKRFPLDNKLLKIDPYNNNKNPEEKLNRENPPYLQRKQRCCHGGRHVG